MIKKFLMCSLIIIFIIGTIIIFNYNKPEIIKVGVIDSLIPNDCITSYNITDITQLIEGETSNSLAHGIITLEIISNEVSNPEFYYAEVLSDDLTGNISDVVNGIRWCIEKDVDIICMSFATFKDDEGLKQIIQEAIGKGIKIVAATVNYSDVDCYPAMYDGVISVSVGFNENATIIFENEPLKVSIEGQELYLKGTSVYTAYACGKMALK